MIDPYGTPIARRRQFERRMDRYPSETRSSGILPIIAYALLGWAGVWFAMWIAGWLA